ncbi:MAG: ferredoxin--NADP reductase [Chloroflexi bacterium]|nr:ferredoxin--NADP reductase [Chloroflexota bacterium]
MDSPTRSAAVQVPATGFSEATVVERVDLTPDLMVIKLAPSIPFRFKPGQYCTIGVENVERAYSIVSAPWEPYIELFIELVPHGKLTPKLWRLHPGDAVNLRPKAKGLFTFEEKHTTHVMVATVTGVAPYISILRDYLRRGGTDHQFHVLHGASYQDEFGYKDELEKMAREHPNIVYAPTVSRPDDPRNQGWPGAKGRVNLILEGYLERAGLKPSTSLLVYACGHPGMTEDVKARFLPRGYKVKEERYWK